ncbi:hypothetical protein RISINGSUN_185 [Erwinia phage vB_EamM_RisingSun]|uniref:Uncharacterized protein n=1 Tax=Erwinia phage vB_EamM_RisingSun TaxID=2026080 RepID=A0A223LHN5_9CAUD|nr:hypothetical protein FDI45_gp185 [Erwinia phage vB_EamM_RisingSun]ASU03485.1 hypothetical protein RISINGSUN_185 [Erwinia phage vB_EamM_RisingSun]
MTTEKPKMTSTPLELFEAFEELQSDIFAKHEGESITPELLGRVEADFFDAINLWRYRPSLIPRTKGRLLSVKVTVNEAGNGLTVTPSDDLKTILEDLIREALRDKNSFHSRNHPMLESGHFRSQLNLFVKYDGRLLNPFLSTIERPDAENQHVEHLFIGFRKSFDRLFHTDGFEKEFPDLIRRAEQSGKATLAKSHVEIIVIKSAMGINPETLVNEHNLGEYTGPKLVLSGGAIDVLHKLFWFGPQNVGDLPSKAGESELRELGYCQRMLVKNAPKDRDQCVIMLTAPGLLYAIKQYQAAKNLPPSDSAKL